MRYLALACACLIWLAGCAAPCDPGPAVTARGIGPGAPSSAGSGDYGLTIRVTEGPGGPLVPGAGVVVYWGGDRPGDWGGPLVRVTDEEVLVAPGNFSSVPRAEQTVRLLTGADGSAHASLPAGTVVAVVAAKDGYTEEYTLAMATGDAGGSDTLEMPIFRSELSVNVTGTWGPGGASTAFVTSSDYVWKADPLPFGEEAGATRGYSARLVGLEAVLRWSNEATSFGDLAIAMAPHPGQPTFVADDGEDLGPGAREQHLSLDAARLREANLLDAPDLRMGPATKSGYLAPVGLPYTMEVRASFDRSLADITRCHVSPDGQDDGAGAGVPGWGALGTVVALLVATMIRRR